jgi:signal transduction histidine kinase
VKTGARLAISTGLAVAATLGAFGVSEQRLRTRELSAALEEETLALARVAAAAIETELDRQPPPLDPELSPEDSADALKVQLQRAALSLTRLERSLRGAMDRIDLAVYAFDQYDAMPAGDSRKERIRKVQIVDKAYGEFLAGPPTYVLTMPVHGRARDLRGAVEMVRDATAIHRSGRQVAIRLGITILALIGLLSLAINTVLRRTVISPIQRLLVGVDEVARGDLSRAVLVERDDEVGRLASHFNEMTHALREAQDETKKSVEARLSLEDRLRHAEKLATMGQLAAEIAHEVGTPLNVIGGRARAIDKKAHDPAEVQKNAAIIGEQVERIARIIQQVLDFSRRRPAARTELDLSASARVAVGLVSHQLEGLRVTARIVAPPGLGVMRGDATAVQQVATNLVLNAAQATPTGGEVTVSTSQVRRRREGLEKAAAQDWLVLEVSDRGPGIAEADRARVFEPFFTTKPDGTGLGLAVTQGIVKDHDGWIEVLAREGGGATFRVFFPAAVLDRARERFVTPIETPSDDDRS